MLLIVNFPPRQALLIIVLLPIYGLAPIKLFPVERTEEFPSLLAMNGSDPNVTYFRSVNLWIGLTPLDLIRLGAKFSPCMRKDFGIRRTIITSIRENTSNPSYGCCQNQDRIGNSVLSGCITATHNPTSETFFEAGTRCSDSNTTTNGANFHPCCISITGQCAIMELEQCTARGGFYHVDTDSCDNVRRVMASGDYTVECLCR